MDWNAIGIPEMIILAMLIPVLLGARKLPTFIRALGRSMEEFRRAREDFERELHRLSRREEDLDPPSAEDFEPGGRLLQKTFRPRFSGHGRNWIVTMMMLICLALLLFALAR